MPDRVATIRNLIEQQPTRPGQSADFLQRVCRTAARTLSASGTGISVVTDEGVHGVRIASDSHSARIEELQFVLGEGPCVDAFDSCCPVLIPDLADAATRRWPMYTPAAHEGGIRAVFAFPLQAGGARLGVLDVFREHVGALSQHQFADALTFADITVEALLDRQENLDIAGDGFSEAVEHRAELFQAQGMVMVQIDGTLTDAMVRMRAYAYAENCGFGDIARDVLARRLCFDRDRP